MTYPGHVHNGVVILDQPARIPEGTLVRVEVLTSVDSGESVPAPSRRPSGQYAGQITFAPDFDEWPADIQESLGILP